MIMARTFSGGCDGLCRAGILTPAAKRVPYLNNGEPQNIEQGTQNVEVAAPPLI